MNRLISFLGCCLISTGALAQTQSSIPEEITGYRDMVVSLSKDAGDCNLNDSKVFEARLSDKLAGIGVSQTDDSYARVTLMVTGQKFGGMLGHCVTLVELAFEGVIGKDNFVTSDERLKATIDRLGVIPVIFYEDGRLSIQPQTEPAAGGASRTSEKAALAMIDQLVESLEGKRK